ncbi:50S ribosomal protein L15 [Candidatus Collierbacteria bacterium]|nr:50S ribosomal protein L15 [Candidatus Collierbacteria bacterium]
MILNQLKPITTRRAKRLGQGYGSGKGGHTVGRGQKGQKTRGKMPVWFEGGQLPLIRRTPFIRGKRRFKSLSGDPVVITLTQLNRFDTNAEVNQEALKKVLKIPAKRLEKGGAKVVANGKLEKALKVSLPVSATAQKAIEAAGGSVLSK